MIPSGRARDHESRLAAAALLVMLAALLPLSDRRRPILPEPDDQAGGAVFGGLGRRHHGPADDGEARDHSQPEHRDREPAGRQRNDWNRPGRTGNARRLYAALRRHPARDQSRPCRRSFPTTRSPILFRWRASPASRCSSGSRPRCRAIRWSTSSVTSKEHPGKFNYASTGIGTSIHLAGAFFAYKAGLQMSHVPYTNASQTITDLGRGEVQVLFYTYAAADAAGPVRTGENPRHDRCRALELGAGRAHDGGSPNAGFRHAGVARRVCAGQHAGRGGGRARKGIGARGRRPRLQERPWSPPAPTFITRRRRSSIASSVPRSSASGRSSRFPERRSSDAGAASGLPSVQRAATAED